MTDPNLHSTKVMKAELKPSSRSSKALERVLDIICSDSTVLCPIFHLLIVGISRRDRLDFNRKGPLVNLFHKVLKQEVSGTVQKPRGTVSRLGAFLASHIISCGLSVKAFALSKRWLVPSVR